MSRYLNIGSAEFQVLIIDASGLTTSGVGRRWKCYSHCWRSGTSGSVMNSRAICRSPKWENIFKDPMTTAAAIDRLVHHSVILELNVPSYRLEQAKQVQEPDSQ